MSVQEIITSLEHANDTRYLSAVGLVVLLYDHFLTLDDEIKYVWRAPTSLPKIGFLFNRYLVLACLVAIACEICGFSITLSDTGCREFLFTTSMFGVISIGIANVLVLLRVVLLWEDRPVVFKFMSVGFSTGFIAQFVCMIIANIKLGPSISWSPIAKMCIISSSTPLYIAVWVSPMLFEVLVLVSTAVNALDRPRTAQTRIVSALHSDGVAYFFALTILRSLNLAMAATANPSLTLMTVFFVWAMTTTVLNRSLLNFRVSNTKPSSTSPPNPPRRGSPFGTGHLSNSTVKVVDMDDMTLCWDAGRHKPSESIGSSTRLMRLDSRERSRRGLPESDWFPDV